MTYKQTLRMIKRASGLNHGMLPQAFTDINLGLDMQRALRSFVPAPQGYNNSNWLFGLVPGLLAGGMSLFGGSGNKQQPTTNPAQQLSYLPQGVKPLATIGNTLARGVFGDKLVDQAAAKVKETANTLMPLGQRVWEGLKANTAKNTQQVQ